MNTQKWWQDNDRYIPKPWDEIELLRKELDQMSITEAALRESLTGLSRESVEYRHKIETENAELRDALRNCAYAASGQNWQQIAWIVEGALAEKKQS